MMPPSATLRAVPLRDAGEGDRAKRGAGGCHPIAEHLRAAAAQLRSAGIENPALEARLLLAHALNTTSESLLLHRTRPVAAATLDALVTRRMNHEPLAFITGRRDFWTLTLAVSPATLIPRPDSETLIEAAIAALPDRTRVRSILDLGTGTGCLLLAALTEFAAAWGVGIDASRDAIRLAARNALSTGLASRASMVCGSWGETLRARFDLVLCNPPYIETADIEHLAPEVAAHEPSSALDGGADGLAAYRLLLPGLARLLAPDGLAVLEIGQGQAIYVEQLADAAGLDSVAVHYDLRNILRVVVLRSRTATKKPFGDTAPRG
jgi:release factor glutamine methyltransferase